MKYFFFIVLGIISVQLYAQNFNCIPRSKGNHQIINYSQFIISYNDIHEQPDWVAYDLTRIEALSKLNRCDCFKEDHNVILGSATLADYTSSGFDRGHLSPAGDNNTSEKANRESFLLSNMSPQLPSFNRGIWEHLESWVREQAILHEQIYIATGPVFINNLGKIGKNNVTIPGYFYKVLLRFEGEKAYSIGFLLPHIGATGEFKEYAVPVNTIETLTGIDFYPDLPNTIENKVESQFYLKKWDL
ncbi:DNA/RNA non-specific endonuclease [Saccharicrinis aurantiacus]|uniref:DNA/RNA non-specific endonuclease n=1 Tax=Saccharicrinis aurantiacus TaxID=1849719 RepID=UPI0009FA4105|nr:DNA/RNA non-specific endonuclease [Saccharicrinis aurantiacus]